jgi:hypothetical protein
MPPLDDDGIFPQMGFALATLVGVLYAARELTDPGALIRFETTSMTRNDVSTTATGLLDAAIAEMLTVLGDRDLTPVAATLTVHSYLYDVEGSTKFEFFKKLERSRLQSKIWATDGYAKRLTHLHKQQQLFETLYDRLASIQ